MDPRRVAKKDIEVWLTKVAKTERDVPYFVLDRKKGPEAITPRKAIEKLADGRQVMNFTAASMVRARGLKAEGGGDVLTRDQATARGYDIVFEQVKHRLHGMRGKFLLQPGLSFSAPEIIQEIENDTEHGKLFRSMFTDYYNHCIGKL